MIEFLRDDVAADVCVESITLVDVTPFCRCNINSYILYAFTANIL